MAPDTKFTKLEIGDSEPLYKQVERSIVRCLAEGEWAPGDQLPSEGQLAERLGVAVFTVRAGIKDLVAADILIRKQGKGTFVARHTLQRQRSQFSHVFRKNGMQIFPVRTLLSFEKGVPSRKVADILGVEIKRRPTIYKVGCLLALDGEPVSNLDITIPIHIFEGLTGRAIREGLVSVYAVYQDVCGLNVIRIQEHIYGGIAKGPIPGILKIKKNTPVLKIERIAYTYDDIPVEFRIRYLDATKYHYRLDEGGV